MHSGTRIVFRALAIFTLFAGFLYLVSCSEQPGTASSSENIGILDDTILNYNQQIVRDESQEIEDYIKRHQWQMKTTQTGLRYMIYKVGKGPGPKKGDVVDIRYSISLLDGNPVYKSDSLIPIKFETGRRRIPSGLEEGVMLMKQGEKAKLIVPSHLAFGLMGDLDKIPRRAILVYDVEIFKINQLNK